MKLLPVFFGLLLMAGCATVSSPRVSQVKFGETIWTAGQRSAGVLFHDGGQAIPVAGGTLWPRPAPHRTQIVGSRGTTSAFLPTGHVGQFGHRAS